MKTYLVFNVDYETRYPVLSFLFGFKKKKDAIAFLKTNHDKPALFARAAIDGDYGASHAYIKEGIEIINRMQDHYSVQVYELL